MSRKRSQHKDVTPETGKVIENIEIPVLNDTELVETQILESAESQILEEVAHEPLPISAVATNTKEAKTYINITPIVHPVHDYNGNLQLVGAGQTIISYYNPIPGSFIEV